MSEYGYDQLYYPPAVPWWPEGYGPESPYERLYAALARQQWAPPALGEHRYDWAHRGGKVKGKKGKGAGARSPGGPVTSTTRDPRDPYGDPYADPYAQQQQQMQQWMQQQQWMQMQQQMQQQAAMQRPGSAAEQYYDPSGFISAPWQGPQPDTYTDDYMAAQQQLLNGLDGDGQGGDY